VPRGRVRSRHSAAGAAVGDGRQPDPLGGLACSLHQHSGRRAQGHLVHRRSDGRNHSGRLMSSERCHRYVQTDPARRTSETAGCAGPGRPARSPRRPRRTRSLIASGIRSRHRDFTRRCAKLLGVGGACKASHSISNGGVGTGAQHL